MKYKNVPSSNEKNHTLFEDKHAIAEVNSKILIVGKEGKYHWKEKWGKVR